MISTKNFPPLFASILIGFVLFLQSTNAEPEQNPPVALSNASALAQVQQANPNYCTFNSDCTYYWGINSRCYSGRCICNLGYIPVNGKCSKVICTFDSDCTRLFYNTRCWFSSCSCVSGTYLDSYSQTCLFNNPNYGVKVGVPVGVFFFIFFSICCAWWFMRQRRLRAVRVYTYWWNSFIIFWFNNKNDFLL